ncbi:MAG: hypothetical protein LAQ69_28575 [Acidobacteriia bacterium]|nr:hypothetical protein [Terriglobia bacterium]
MIASNIAGVFQGVEAAVADDGLHAEVEEAPGVEQPRAVSGTIFDRGEDQGDGCILPAESYDLTGAGHLLEVVPLVARRLWIAGGK